MGVLTPQLRAQALREAADALENDPGITKGRITGTGYTLYSAWLRDEADMWLEGRAPNNMPTRCNRCGKDPAEGSASTSTQDEDGTWVTFRLCHGETTELGRTCYEWRTGPW